VVPLAEWKMMMWCDSMIYKTLFNNVMIKFIQIHMNIPLKRLMIIVT
jgi:hypothetical protein